MHRREEEKENKLFFDWFYQTEIKHFDRIFKQKIKRQSICREHSSVSNRTVQRDRERGREKQQIIAAATSQHNEWTTLRECRKLFFFYDSIPFFISFNRWTFSRTVLFYIVYRSSISMKTIGNWFRVIQKFDFFFVLLVKCMKCSARFI